MIEFLMLASLWCSTPSYSRLTQTDINNCREKVIKCYSKNQNEILNCIKDIKL